MGDSRPTGSWLAVIIAALVGMVAVIWLPVVLPVTAAKSPLHLAGSSSLPLPPVAKLGLTVLLVGAGAGIGAGVVWITLHWHRSGE